MLVEIPYLYRQNINFNIFISSSEKGTGGPQMNENSRKKQK
jgi:hypothetical protein